MKTIAKATAKSAAKAAARIVPALTLAACVMTAGAAVAAEGAEAAAGAGSAGQKSETLSRSASHRGFFFGLNAGGGGSHLMFKDGTRHISEEPLAGGLGMVRIGYDVSRHFAVGVEGIGFDSKEDEANWDLGAMLAVVTWRPCNHGLFLRAGVGVGGGEFTNPANGEQVSVDGRLAGMFGIGYEWRLGEHTGLGLAFDGVTIDANEGTGFEEDQAGAGGATVQFNWYL